MKSRSDDRSPGSGTPLTDNPIAFVVNIFVVDGIEHQSALAQYLCNFLSLIVLSICLVSIRCCWWRCYFRYLVVRWHSKSSHTIACQPKRLRLHQRIHDSIWNHLVPFHISPPNFRRNFMLFPFCVAFLNTYCTRSGHRTIANEFTIFRSSNFIPYLTFDIPRLLPLF